ncbi:hypothetical protein CHS0354_000809 [Potamilus streckersoni]|uniref:6,7-dimethyl-8-ribityllumazine synthase n=1 Tax=Potamilus streckersoni TaxID=2493646 RepID=A0AAE0T8C3_9BIVA|nr:hypothetical protein CHS0354_000809 [Potamilus streckersoni]
MTNRNDIVSITASNTFKHVLTKISETGFSRFPFYEKDIDNITGVVYAKNLVQFLPKRSGKIDWKRFSRKPIFIPETLHLDDVLDIFQSNQIHIAIVIDEYGSVAGLVTLDDIVEELLEDISMDIDRGSFKKTSDSTYWFSGATSIEELASVIQIEFPKATSADTVGGFILSLTGDIPKENDTVTYRNLTFTIERVRKNRIGAKECLTKHGISKMSIYRCPGAFEIPLVIKKLLGSSAKPDGIVAVGVLIRGETIHFDLIAKDVSASLQKLALDYLTPVGLGILATENTSQAIERAGVKSGNKGTEAALAVIEMVQLMKMI